VQSDLLIAEEFDVRRLELTGRAMLVARGVSPPSLGYDNVVSAAGGLLAFRHGVTEQNLAWVDRSGEIQSTLSMPTVLFNPRLSPDGSRLLATSSVTSDPGLWLTSLTRAEVERLETVAIAPLWAPDGAGVAFSARGGFDLLVRAIDAEGAARPLLSNGAVKILNDWSPDGTHIVYTQLEDETKLDLWRVRLGDAAAMPLLATPFNEMQARISPDGRWIAYASDESGVLEIYVQRYPELVEKRMVSSGGGGQPQWRADQRELFYLSADRSLVAVAVAADTADTISFGAPRRMFRAPVAGDPDDARDHYAASADGVKFLVDSAVDNSDGTAITVIVNWAGETGDRSRERAMPAELVSRLLR
jgi:dipeptidyl aminopeptidase/acylaminoacyl peptidase